MFSATSSFSESLTRSRSRRSPPRRENRPTGDPDVFAIGSGESYRPGGDSSYRPSPRGERDRDQGRFTSDSWTAERRDTRRDDRRDERREDIDSYVPPTSSRAARPRSRSPTFRRRSRTPPNRREDLFANRRSPSRRYSPRRSPPRRRSRSPPPSRPRSPPESKRFRDFSPEPGRRSPRRERRFSPERCRDVRDRSPFRDSPRGGGGENYRPRSRSPLRRRQNDTWTRRSPSPRDSVPASHDTSRRSSPPIHPDRASLAGSQTKSPGPLAPRNHYDRADAGSYRDRSPPPPAPAEPVEDRDLSIPREDVHMNGTEPRQPPSGPSSHRNGNNDRPPPTGPSASFSQPMHSPPTGPAASMSMSAHNRGGGVSSLRPPSGPRGALGRFDGPPERDFSSPRGRGSLAYRGPAPFGPRGGGYGRGESSSSSTRRDFGSSNTYRGDYSTSTSYRGGGYGRGGSLSVGGPVGGGGSVSTEPTSFPFHGNNSSSTTYPRTQRFNAAPTTQSYLTTTEKLLPQGKLLPSGLPPDQEKRIKLLEAEAERMRAEIAEKQRAKREVLNEWEVRERESEREALRSGLAESHLQALVEGDNGVGRAAF